MGNEKAARSAYFNFEIDAKEFNARFVSLDTGISIEAILSQKKSDITKKNIEQSIAKIKLETVGAGLDVLTPEQQVYLTDYTAGT